LPSRHIIPLYLSRRWEYLCPQPRQLGPTREARNSDQKSVRPERPGDIRISLVILPYQCKAPLTCLPTLQEELLMLMNRSTCGTMQKRRAGRGSRRHRLSRFILASVRSEGEFTFQVERQQLIIPQNSRFRAMISKVYLLTSKPERKIHN
jgi:hypothetical protein